MRLQRLRGGRAVLGAALLVVAATGPLTGKAKGVAGGAQVAQTPGSTTTPATPAATTPPAVPALDGPGLFRERGCAQCHEIRGAGGHKGPDLSGIGRRMKPEAIQQQILQGGGAMPPFEDVLNPNETATLVAYLKHCRDKTKSKGKAAPAPAATPAPQPE